MAKTHCVIESWKSKNHSPDSDGYRGVCSHTHYDAEGQQCRQPANWSVRRNNGSWYGACDVAAFLLATTMLREDLQVANKPLPEDQQTDVEQALRQSGRDLLWHMVTNDHHPLTVDDVRDVLDRAEAHMDTPS